MINIKQLMFDKSLSQRRMAEIMNTTQSEVSQIGNGNRRMLRKHIDGLIEFFGEDVINQYAMPDEPLKPITQSATVTIIDPEIVEEAKELGREEARGGDVTLSVPFVDKAVATSPDLNVRELVREKGHTFEEFPFYKMVKGVDYIQAVITMAMAPRYLPGDYLFIRFRDGQVLSGKIYLVDTRLYGTMLRLVYIEEGGYILKALNPEFKDVYVRVDDVYSISSVVLSVNTNTSLTSDVNLATLVKNRDAQIATLTESQGTMLAQQQSLIDEVRKQNDRLDKERERADKLIEKIINQ